MRVYSVLFILVSFTVLGQATSEPSLVHTTVSDFPFHAPLNNEFKDAAEEMMVKKWSQQILAIIIADEATLTQNNPKELFVIQIRNRAMGKRVRIPIGIKMNRIRKIKLGDVAAREQFIEDTEGWIRRFI